MEPKKEYGELDARKMIATYGSELAWMAKAARAQYEDLDPPGAILCEPGTSEAQSLEQQLDPRLPLRVVDDGVAMCVLSRSDLRRALEKLAAGCLPFLDQDEFAGPGRLPILAVCRNGCLMGAVAIPEG